jgi:hypothetical protein
MEHPYIGVYESRRATFFSYYWINDGSRRSGVDADVEKSLADIPVSPVRS